MKTYFILFFVVITNISFSQTITGNYMLQLIGGLGGDGKLTNKAKKIDIYSYTFHDSKSKMELINPTGTQIDTLKKYNPEYDFHYETVETTIHFSKSTCVKDLKNRVYERIWISDGEEDYKKEKLSEINWTITNETKIIEGFLCKKAVTELTKYGYTISYTAWYSEKIPVNDGPFEYGGLPGFILEISAENLFICKFVNFKYDENLKTNIEYIRDSK
jgi:GLPGLI family protein